MASTTRDILDQIKIFHKEISTFYNKVSKETKDPRVKMMMDFLENHESDLGEAINEFEANSTQDILGFNIKYTPDLNFNELIDNIDYSPSMPVTEVLKIVLSFNDKLISIYKQLANESESKGVSELFQNLVKMEEKDKLTTVRNSLELENI